MIDLVSGNEEESDGGQTAAILLRPPQANMFGFPHLDISARGGALKDMPASLRSWISGAGLHTPLKNGWSDSGGKEVQEHPSRDVRVGESCGNRALA